VLWVALPQIDRASGCKQPRLIREGDAMSFGLYAIGLAIAIGGLVYGTHLVHMPRVLDCHGFKTAGAGRAGGFFYWREGSPEVLAAVFV